MMSCHRVQANHGNQLKLAEENERLVAKVAELEGEVRPPGCTPLSSPRVAPTGGLKPT